MKLQKATVKDMPAIMDIIAAAQHHLAFQKIDQWQDGYPSEKQIRTDIENQQSYIVVEQNVIIGTTVLMVQPEPSYQKITGSWITATNNCYGVIHRLAIANKHRRSGVAKFVVDAFETMIKNHEKAISIRIDTHPQNVGMINLLNNNHFQHCGGIYLENGDYRLAFEKVMDGQEFG